MSHWLSFLRPAQHIQEMQDQGQVDKSYRYWRIRIFYAMFVGYVFYYFTRKSFTFAMPGLVSLGFTKSQLGILGSVSYLSYGVSKFASGVMSDQSNPRYFMALGLIITGIMNICFGLSSTLIWFVLFWGINGWFQGWGWPPCARLLTHWYSHSERGAWWSVWSTSHNVGGFLIPLLASRCVEYFGWRYALFVPGVLCILMGLFLINRLRDTPQSLGLPSIEKYRNDYPTAQKDEESLERELTTREILFGYVLNNKWLWMLAMASFFVYIVRMGINDWSVLYLMESKRCTVVQASFCVSGFELGGLFGMLLAGWLSDKWYAGRRGPMNVYFSLGMLLSVGYLWLFPGVSLRMDSIMLFVVGFFLFGPQMLIGLAAAELSHKKAAGTASGFAGWFAYFGAAAAGYPLGKIAQDLGWNGFFLVLTACCIITILLFLPMWNAHGQVVKK